MEKEITFVAQHYRKGAFNAEAAWARLGIAAASKWRGPRLAAALAAAIAFTAVASIAYLKWDAAPQPSPAEIQEIEAPLTTIRAIDFENTPLPEVVAAIKVVYGVDVENLPANAADYRLSLHYEGSAAELVETINDILGTQMTVAQ